MRAISQGLFKVKKSRHCLISATIRGASQFRGWPLKKKKKEWYICNKADHITSLQYHWRKKLSLD